MTKFWLNYGGSGEGVVITEDGEPIIRAKCPCCPCGRCNNASLPRIDVDFTGFSNNTCDECGDVNTQTFTTECVNSAGTCIWRVDPDVCSYDRLEVKLTYPNPATGNTLIEVAISDSAGSGQSVSFTKDIGSGDDQQDCCAWDDLDINDTVTASSGDCTLSIPTCKITAHCCAPPTP